MSRYMLYGDTLRPSDSYLRAHPDFDYEPDTWFSDDYDLENDEEILNMSRQCKKCGCSFTVSEAIRDFASRISGASYAKEYEGEYCGNCAADKYEKNFR